MVDILANGDFGRDDGLECEAVRWVQTPDGTEARICGGKTFLVDDQGGGLCGYECEDCGESFQVQYEWDDDEGDDPENYYESDYAELAGDDF